MLIEAFLHFCFQCQKWKCRWDNLVYVEIIFLKCGSLLKTKYVHFHTLFRSFWIYEYISFNPTFNKMENAPVNFFCTYDNCAKYSVNILQPCQNVGCSNWLHHLCQTAFEQINNLNLLLVKRCQKCLMELVCHAPQEKKEKGLFNTSVELSPVVYNYNQYLGMNHIDKG